MICYLLKSWKPTNKVRVSSRTQKLALEKSFDIPKFHDWMNIIYSKNVSFKLKNTKELFHIIRKFLKSRFSLNLKCYWSWNWHFLNKLHSSNYETIESQRFFSKQTFVFLSLPWPCLWVFMNSIGNIWWVWNLTWLSYALEQPEWLRSL